MVHFDHPEILSEFAPATREAIMFNSLFPELFIFIFRVRFNDCKLMLNKHFVISSTILVPVDLFKTAIWVLQCLQRSWEECSYRQLHALAFLDCPESAFQPMKLSVVCNTSAIIMSPKLKKVLVSQLFITWWKIASCFL